jgi:putative flippase GtrA
MSSLKSIAKRSGKYLGVSAFGTVVESFILWFLSESVFRGFESRYIIAPVISFECAVINNFLFSYFWIWKECVGRTAQDLARRFVAYNLATFLVFLIRLALLAGLGSMTGWHPVVCNLIALTTTGVFNFFVQNEGIFRPDFVFQNLSRKTVTQRADKSLRRT